MPQTPNLPSHPGTDSNHTAPVRLIAVSRLHLPTGRILLRRVVEISATGEPLRHYPLTEELPHTEWRGGDYYWPKKNEE